MLIGAASEAEAIEVARFVANLQADPVHHIGYFGSGVDALMEQIRGLEPAGILGTVVARDDNGSIVGVLSAEWDRDPPRVWWHGPSVREGDDWDEIADGLYDAAARLLPVHVTEHELAPDARNDRVAAFGRRHGFTAGVASAVLSRPLDPLPESAVTGVTVRGFVEADRTAVARLHDELFPGTHLPGARLDEGDERRVLVALVDDVVVAYVAAEVQEDGESYLDYLGVATAMRGRGIGRMLVVAACERLAADGAGSVHLTVREDNPGARRVYASLGFEEERLLVPWRREVTVRASDASPP